MLALVSAACIALYFAALANGGWTIASLSLNPWVGPPQGSLLALGALQATLVSGGGQWWRIFSSPFVSAGVIQVRAGEWRDPDSGGGSQLDLAHLPSCTLHDVLPCIPATETLAPPACLPPLPANS